MAEATPTDLSIGDRSQGYEVSGPGAVAGLDAAYAGKDTSDGGSAVTLVQLADGQDPASLLESARAFATVDHEALIGLRTTERFGAGSVGVIGKEDGAPLAGETLALWLERRAPVSMQETARLFLPILDALEALHARGLAHGSLSGTQIIIGRDGDARLLGPWLAAGSEPMVQAQTTKSPERLAGETPGPVSDVFSVAMLLRWALSGTVPPSADDRLASQARRDQDPLVPMSEAAPGTDEAICKLLDSALRLHPATRPQSISEITSLLEPYLEPNAEAAPTAPPPPLPQSPWSRTSETADGPPPLPASKPRSASVPPMPKHQRTSRIGEAPPPLPQGAGAKGSPKRKIGLGTIISFILALAVAWIVASGGLLGSSEQGSSPEPTVRESPQQVEPEDTPRKGPTTTANEDSSEPSPDGVRAQICNSRFTFETARDAGANALRAYLEQCDGISSDYVQAARDVLGVN